jgi:CRISPR-associated exonuclease Cas4
LRATTLTAIESAHAILGSGRTPPPTQDKKRCKACSLLDLCEPNRFRNDKSANYIEKMFDENRQIDLLGDSK